MRQIATLSALALLAACSAEAPEPAPTDTHPSESSALPMANDDPAADASQPSGPAPASASPAPAAAAERILRLEGLGDLEVGKAIPKASSWAVRGAQISDECLVASSPQYPGAYAIVEDGKVRRISLGERSDVKLIEGVGVGASEADVKKWFAGFREAGHAYDDPPAKYLTAPNARPGESALRFEIDADRRVSHIHVGEMPTLGYVEGCA